jgi:hypothetical protein
MNQQIPRPEDNRDEPGIAVSLSIIGLYVCLQMGAFISGVSPGPMKQGLGTVLMGLSLIVIGVAFLASYYYSQKAFLFRGLMWLCENFSRPSGRGMAFFYCILASSIGIMAVLAGLGII